MKQPLLTKNLIDKNQEIWYNTLVSKWIADEQQGE